MSQNGKTDKARPFSVPTEVYKDNYERTFGKKDVVVSEPLPNDIQQRIDAVTEKLEKLHTEILHAHDTTTGQTERVD